MDMDTRGILAEMEQILNERSEPADVARDLKKAVNLTRKYVRGIDNMMSAAAELAQYVKNVGSGSTLPTVSRLDKALRNYKKEVDLIYGVYADGRSEMYKVFKKMGQKTRRSGTGKTAKYGDITRNLRMLNEQVKATAEFGAFWLRKADDVLSAISTNSADEATVERLLEEYLDFRDSANAAWGMMEGLFKRAKLVKREIQDRIGIERIGEAKESVDEEEELDLAKDPEIPKEK